MGSVRTAGEAPSRPLSPSRLPLRAHFHRERDVWVRASGYSYPPDNSLSTDSSVIGFPNTYPLDSDLSGE